MLLKFFKPKETQKEKNVAFEETFSTVSSIATSSSSLGNVLNIFKNLLEDVSVSVELLERMRHALEPHVAYAEVSIHNATNSDILLAALGAYHDFFIEKSIFFVKSSQDQQTRLRFITEATAHVSARTLLAKISYAQLPDNWKSWLPQAWTPCLHLLTRKMSSLEKDETSLGAEIALLVILRSINMQALSQAQIVYVYRFLRAMRFRLPLRQNTGTLSIDENILLSQTPSPFGLFLDADTLTHLALHASRHLDPWPVWAGEPIKNNDTEHLRVALHAIAALGRPATRHDRKHDRLLIEDEQSSLVVSSFEHIRRCIAFSSYVRRGGRLDVYSRDFKIRSSLQDAYFSMDDSIEKIQLDENITPLEILRTLETTSSGMKPDQCKTRDISHGGIGIVMTTTKSWMKVGQIVAARAYDSLEWRLAVIRRIQTIQREKIVGVQWLGSQMRPAGIIHFSTTEDPGKINLSDTTDAVLIDSTHVLLKKPVTVDIGYTFVSISAEGRLRHVVTGFLMETDTLLIASITSSSPSIE